MVMKTTIIKKVSNKHYDVDDDGDDGDGYGCTR